MIYLDYSATTKINPDVLESYNKVCNDYFANPNSLHKEGIKAHDLYLNATRQIASLLNIDENEIIYTSGATESNNMALLGSVMANKRLGNHILVSKLEHPSIYNICKYLNTLGFIIEYVDIDSNGLINFDDLKQKVTSETVLVSICGVNSELGIRQPLKTLRQIIKKENPNTIFHSDLTQCMGKVPCNFNDVDLATISAHKFYGPRGIGILYKNKNVKIDPIIIGGEAGDLRGGTINLPSIVAMSKALRIILKDENKNELYVKKINEKIINHLSKYNNILINNTSYSIPHIVNISLMNIKPETFIHALETHDIYVGSNTACSKGKVSASVYALYNDMKRAETTIRISLSYLTTNEEINEFLRVFDENYEKLEELVS